MEIFEQDETTLSYDRCKFYINYQDKEGNIKNYNPDFIVNYFNSPDKIIEIKSSWCIDKYNNPLKFKAGREFAIENNMLYEVWTEEKLDI